MAKYMQNILQYAFMSVMQKHPQLDNMMIS